MLLLTLVSSVGMLLIERYHPLVEVLIQHHIHHSLVCLVARLIDQANAHSVRQLDSLVVYLAKPALLRLILEHVFVYQLFYDRFFR